MTASSPHAHSHTAGPGADTAPSAAATLAVRLDFLQMTPARRAALRAFWPKAQAALPALLDGFHGHVSGVPELSQRIGARTTQLKGAQTTHWERLFSARFDAAYLDGVRAIGLAHVRIGLEPRWYIGGYSFVLNGLIAAAQKAHRFAPARLVETLQAISTAVMLDMDIAISVYQETLMEERAKRARSTEAAIKAFEAEIARSLSAFNGSSQRLSGAAGTLTAGATQMSTQALTVSAAAEEASANVQTVAAAGEELSASIGEIARQASAANQVASNAAAEARKTDAEVASLAETAQRVGDIVQLISGIAAQTNLLALNATIEAARAGEAGRGFAVVAQEVKALASQTAKATEEISGQIEAIQTQARRAVDAIGRIGQTISSVSESAAAIAAAVEQQGAATQNISRNVQEAANATTGVTRTIAEISHAAAASEREAKALDGQSHALAQEADGLRKAVDTFFSAVRTA